MLHAIKAKNLVTHFYYVLEPDILGHDGKQYYMCILDIWTMR
jgi:hypothetical protein